MAPPAFLVSIGRTVNDLIFEYETQKIVTVRSYKIGILYRCLQVFIIAYIVGYALIYDKGYQEFDIGQSVIMTKIKGGASSLNRTDLPQHLQKVWDSADYVVPPMLRDSVFITTNLVVTPKQKIGDCPEDPFVNPKAICDPSNVTCEKGIILRNGNGPMTGNCVKSDRSANYTCEITSWCPLEDDSVINRMTKPVLHEVENFTILLKNVVSFPYFGVTRRNIDALDNATYARTCTYHPDTDPLCPIFVIGDIVKFAEGNITEIGMSGGAVNILIRWYCNLDFKLDHCKPEFEFTYLKGRKDLSGFSPGFNFRYSLHRKGENGSVFRDLVKAYGILIVFSSETEAGKFSIVQLGLNIGAGLALLGLASVFMDWMLLNVSKDKGYYYQQKFITISEEDLANIRRQKHQSANSALADPITTNDQGKTDPASTEPLHITIDIDDIDAS